MTKKAMSRCVTCDRLFRLRRPDDGPECPWCCGVHRCAMCDEVRDIEDFVTYHPEAGKRHIAAKCRYCSASLATNAKFPDRATVFAVYGIEGRLARIFTEAEPVYQYHLHRITRRKGGRGAKHPPSPADVFEGRGVSFEEWLRLCQAMCEVAEAEKWGAINHLEATA